MSILLWILIGGVAGWIAEKATKSDHGLLTNIIVGVIGALIGGWLFGILGLQIAPGLIGSLVTAVIGALILLFGLKFVRGKL